MRVEPMNNRSACADDLLAARSSARLMPLPSDRSPAFDLEAGYAVADEIRRRRIASGERPAGYKIGFTNRGIWERYGVHAPIWGPVWDSSVEFIGANEATVSLAPFVQPRLEPEIVVGLARAPRAGMSVAHIAGCIDWVAHGFEIVHTHFNGWRFRAADTTADFALHGRLLVGPRVPIASFDDAPSQLASIDFVLLRDGEEVDRGHSSIVLDGPLHALRIWIEAMAVHTPTWPMEAGDIVTTGTITDAAPMQPGERWQSRLSEPLLCGLRVLGTE